MPALWRILRELPLALLSPFLVVLTLTVLWAVDALFFLFGSRRPRSNRPPDNQSASIVIPNWNGRDLLAKYLPSVLLATAGNPANEVIVVDNGSTDGSARFVRDEFPSVRVLELRENLGFGGGSNYGFREARNDIVVLLNSDMRVDPEFLAPLLAPFVDAAVFAVSCQIFFSDPKKLREETGLTEGWWAQGGLRVGHRIDEKVTRAFPCFYGGGGSCAFDRGKFLELGGFDELLRPFYFEDTDLGYLAWKRGWKVLYQPNSHVWHEHRGTIGKTFTRSYIDGVLKKNYLLFTWKNIHEPVRLLSSFVYGLGYGLTQLVFGESPQTFSFAGLFRAALQLPQAMAARWNARSLSTITDTEAFRRPQGGYFRDRFQKLDTVPDKPSVLFLSPYPICPPSHGGAVFMSQTIQELGPLTHLHLLTLLDKAEEETAHAELERYCASMEFVTRLEGLPRGFASIDPFAVREFRSRDLSWRIHRTIYLREVDVVQIEYTHMGQYAEDFKNLAVVLFEHDIYFQSIARGPSGLRSPIAKVAAFTEYLRALRYELKLLPSVDQVQVCTQENGAYLEEFLPGLGKCVRHDLRAGVDTAAYHFRLDGREPDTLLFLGSFRHLPNLEALNWLVSEVMPEVLKQRPTVRLVIVGANPPPAYTLPDLGPALELKGFVADAKEPLNRYAIFVCPILSGSGVRVKLLEAFASGIPAISTRIGAEGLSREDGAICALADTPAEFAAGLVALLEDPARAQAMAARAREFVVAQRDIRSMTKRLVESYLAILAEKRAATSSSPPRPTEDAQSLPSPSR